MKIRNTLAPALALAACGAVREEPEPQAAASATVGVEDAPMDLAGAAASNWGYLRSRYDRDGDGEVARAEYDRDGERFARLDLDGDGRLTDADFPELGADTFRGMYRERRAQRVLGMHFQADDDDGELRLDELEWMLTTYDADADGYVDAAEFAAGATEHRREVDDADPSGTERAMMGAHEPWDVLMAVVDGDGNGRLSTGEFVAFFRAGARGGDALSLRSEAAADDSWVRDTSGIPAGERAPDFSLEPPHGGARVRLSAFRGERPVALIFGSYT